MGALKVGILILAAIVAFCFLVYLVSSRFHFEFDATFWTAAGLVLLSFTLIRPWWFWYHPTALFVRSLITDTGATLLYVVLTGSIIVTGVRRQVAITRARHACAQGLASAKNVHERVRVLYRQGVDSLPRFDSGRKVDYSQFGVALSPGLGLRFPLRHAEIFAEARMYLFSGHSEVFEPLTFGIRF